MTCQRVFGTGISGDRQTPQQRRKELNSHDRAWIFEAISLGSKRSAVPPEFGCTQQTVYRTINRARELNHFDSKPRTGRPKKLNCQIKRCLLRLGRGFPNIYFCDLIEVSGAKVCINTLRCALGPNLRRKWRRCKRIRLQEKDVKERLRIARNYRQKDQELVEVCACISLPYDGLH